MSDKYLFHHYDLDGYVGGSIAMASHPDFRPVCCSYDDRMKPLDVVRPGDDVMVVDYSFLPEEMVWMKENCGSFIWIDHHVSAIRLAEENGYSDVFGMRNVHHSGAELAWMALFQGIPLHRFVRMVGEYDTFRNHDGPEFMRDVVPFFYGTQTLMKERLNPANMPDNVMSAYSEGQDVLNESLDVLADACMAAGRTIAKYNRERYAAENEEAAYVRDMFGLRCLCMNVTGHGGSLQLELPGTYDPAKHDMMITYCYNGRTGKWSYGFYSDGHPEVDCSAIAAQFGGGGHRGAAGAVTDRMMEGLL